MYFGRNWVKGNGFSDCYFNEGPNGNLDYRFSINIVERSADWKHYVVTGTAPLYKVGSRSDGKIYDCEFEVEFTIGERHPIMQQYLETH